MIGYSIYKTIFIIFFILVIIGFVTGGSWRRKRQERKSEEHLNEVRRRNEEYMEQQREDYRKLLIRRRKSYLEDVIEKNERHMKMYGVKWEDEQSAMARYDREHRKEWAEAGLKIPDTKDPYEMPRAIL